MSQIATQPAAAPSHLDCCKAYEVQRIAAERELSAFVKAVEVLYGRVESLRATEYWLALAEGADVPLVDGYPVWRDITIQAANLFASTIVQAARHSRLQEDTHVS